MNADGTEVRRLTNQPGDDLFPAWAADNRQIIFYSERDTTLANRTLALYGLDADAENLTPVRLEGALMSLDRQTALPVDAHYLQDNSGQLFMQYNGSDWDIFYADPVGRHATNLTENDSQDLFPTWR
jgi:Tol biopolymer transport system component